MHADLPQDATEQEVVLHVFRLEGHGLLEALQAGGVVLAHLSHDPEAHMGVGEVPVELEGTVVIVGRLIELAHALHALPHQGVRVGLGGIHEDGLAVAFQRLLVILHHGQGRGLLEEGRAELLVDDESKSIGGDGVFELPSPLLSVAEVVPSGAAVRVLVHEGLERRHRFGVAPDRLKAEAKFMEGSLVGRVFLQGLPEHIDGLLPQPDVLVLEGDVDVKVPAEGPVPEVKGLAVMVDGLLVSVRLGVERGQREVDLIVGGLEGQQIPQPGNGVLDIASAGHELCLAQLEGQALRINLAGIMEHLPRLAVATLLKVVLDERLQLHEVEKSGGVGRHHGLVPVHDSRDFARVLIVEFLVVHQLH